MIAVAVPGGWCLLRPTADGRVSVVNAGTAEALATEQARSGSAWAASPAGAAASSAESGVPSAPSVPRPSAARPGRPSAATATPTLLSIPDLDLTAPVDAVGVDGSGDVAVPQDVARIGWYRFGPAPGEGTGSIVLVGHVDSAAAGAGAFFTLHSIRVGADVIVKTADGTTHRYRVRAREEFAKTGVPLAALFARAGSPRLTLITCGGSFDARARSYRDNVVVTAIPISGG